MNSPRNVELPSGTVNDFHWEFKPVLSYSKSHTFSTFFGEEQDKSCIMSSFWTHLNYSLVFIKTQEISFNHNSKIFSVYSR